MSIYFAFSLFSIEHFTIILGTRKKLQNFNNNRFSRLKQIFELLIFVTYDIRNLIAMRSKLWGNFIYYHNTPRKIIYLAHWYVHILTNRHVIHCILACNVFVDHPVENVWEGTAVTTAEMLVLSEERRTALVITGQGQLAPASARHQPEMLLCRMGRWMLAARHESRWF